VATIARGTAPRECHTHTSLRTTRSVCCADPRKGQERWPYLGSDPPPAGLTLAHRFRGSLVFLAHQASRLKSSKKIAVGRADLTGIMAVPLPLRISAL
jgi:hypothetical protein